MIFLLAALLCLTSGLEEDALARSNKLLRKQNEALVKALHTIAEERTVGNSQCDHINEDNKSYKCNVYYRKIVKCDICQDDNAGAVDNSAINDAIRKRAQTRKEQQVGALPEDCWYYDGYEEDCPEGCVWTHFSRGDGMCNAPGVAATRSLSEERAVGAEVTEDEVYTYSVAPGGKCRTLDGEDPKYKYEGGKGSICEQLCDGMNDCFGYSISGYDNCLLWLQRDIMGGGDEWGGADCHIKDISCSGNVGDDYNCSECYNKFSGKYLWGSACQAKNWGADTYTKGVCGEEYKCFTNSEDIGECPYGEYCPSV